MKGARNMRRRGQHAPRVESAADKAALDKLELRGWVGKGRIQERAAPEHTQQHTHTHAHRCTLPSQALQPPSAMAAPASFTFDFLNSVALKLPVDLLYSIQEHCAALQDSLR